jgi:hypothetical protein
VRKVRLWRRGEDLRDRAVLRDLQHGKEGKSRGGSTADYDSGKNRAHGGHLPVWTRGRWHGQGARRGRLLYARDGERVTRWFRHDMWRSTARGHAVARAGCSRGLRGGDVEEFLFVRHWQGVSWTRGAPQGGHATRMGMTAHALTRLRARERGARRRPKRCPHVHQQGKELVSVTRVGEKQFGAGISVRSGGQRQRRAQR